jgi:nitroreductase
MDLNQAILERRSIRSFKPDPVPQEILEKLIDISRWSPSGSNTQPWELIVLGGKKLEEVKDRLVQAMQTGKGNPDIPYPPMPEPYLSRQKAVGQQMKAYRASGVEPKAEANRFSHIRFFEAPDAIIIYTDKEICPRAFLGLGMVAQTICLAALDLGLGTCIMSMATYWPEVYRDMFKIPDSKLIAFGIAIGYPDMEARVNNFPRTRVPLDTFVQWQGF